MGCTAHDRSPSLVWHRGELQLRYPADPALRRLALDLEIEILEGEELRWRKRASPTDEEAYRSRSLLDTLASLPAALATDAEARKRWTVRVSGTNQNVLRSWSADRYWSGRIELPVEELFARAR